jgi:hypothetical protein
VRLRTVSVCFAVAALALVVSAHSAAAATGLNLSWDDCGSAG